MDGDPVTIVITRRVRPGSEATFEQELREWIPRLIEHPGHLGVLLLCPVANGSEYGAVLRFRSADDWRSFQQSENYRAFGERIGTLLVEKPQMQAVTGLEAWFQDSGSKADCMGRFRMAFVTWIGVCIAVGLLGTYFGPLLADWTWFARLLVMNAAVVAALTWIVMPPLIRLAKFSRFLSPNKKG